MRTPVVIALLVLVAAAAVAAGPEPRPTATEPGASEPDDPDMKRDKTCSGHPDASELVGALPTYVRELIVRWPRAGKTQTPAGCASVARLTIINHQGVLMTMSLLVHDPGTGPQPRDYRVLLDDPMPRAVFEMQPDGGRPRFLVEMAGGPSTSRESLEQTLEFVPLEDLLERVGQL